MKKNDTKSRLPGGIQEPFLFTDIGATTAAQKIRCACVIRTRHCIPARQAHFSDHVAAHRPPGHIIVDATALGRDQELTTFIKVL